MGLLDFASKVVTTYKADTKDHVRELEKLKGAEKERAQEAIKQGKELESSLEGQLKTFGKLALGIAAAAGAASVAWDGFNEHLEHGRLTTAAQGADIEALRKASGGLKNEMTLLRDAAAMQTGAFKLSGQQMQDVERAMLALTRQGKDATKVHDAMLQAVTALKVDGLADLGIFVDKAGLSMETADGRAKIFERTMAKLAETSRAAGEGQRSAEEDVVAAGVSLQDAWSKLKRSLGELVVAMAPLLEALAKAVSLIADAARGAMDKAGDLGRNETFQKYFNQGTGMLSAMRGAAADRDALEDQVLSRQQGFDPRDPYVRAKRISHGWTWAEIESGSRNPASAASDATTAADILAALKLVAQDAGNRVNDPWADKSKRGGKGKVDVSAALRILRGARNGEDANVGASGTGTYGLGAEAGEGQYDMTKLLNQQLADKLGAKSAEQQSFLAKTFGPIEEFNVYAKGFEVLSGAVGASMSAWIDGSMSAGAAFKKFVGEALKSLASQMLVESLKHGAYAIGSLAFGNAAGAAKHGAAAAAFAGGAIAAGVAARALGGGGGAQATAGGGRGAGAAAPSSAPGSTDRSGHAAIVVIGNSFAHDSPRSRQLHAQELVDMATRQTAVVYG